MADTIDYRGHEIQIVNDEDPTDPREWDNMGTMVCRHRDYNLGDEQIPDSIDTVSLLREWINKKYGEVAVILPLYLLDHSGISISTGRYSCDPQGWDTSFVGFIFITKDKIRKDYSVKRITKSLLNKVTDNLVSEVKTYDDYLTDSVYGYTTDTDSCFGFYGYPDGYNQAIADAKAAIDCQIKKDQQDKEKKLKQYIKNRVPYEYRFV